MMKLIFHIDYYQQTDKFQIFVRLLQISKTQLSKIVKSEEILDTLIVPVLKSG